MTCLNERMVGALFFMLSGFAYAHGLVMDSPGEMIVANIVPLPVEVVPPIPEPQSFLQRYEMEYQLNKSTPFFASIANFYSAEVTHEFRFGAANAPLAPGESPQAAVNYLHLSTAAAQLAIVDMPNTTLTLGSQPQRRLSLTVDEWVFSATARVAILKSHSTGATLSVRRGF